MFRFGLLTVLLAAFVLPNAFADSPTYTVGVVPQFDSRRIVEIWQPILEQVGKRSEIRLVLKASPSIPEFERQFSAGEFDFAYMNPYHLIVAHEKQGYVPLVRDIGRELYGIIVVKKDSPLRDVSELDGKTVAFPAPNALGAALIPRAEFSNKYHIRINERYVKSHSSVYLNVALGLADAGGGVERTLNQQPREVRNQLRILYKTRKVPPHPLVVHPRVGDEVSKQVSAALLRLGANSEGRKMLARVPFRRIGPTTIKDYEVLRGMGLSEFYIY